MGAIVGGVAMKFIIEFVARWYAPLFIHGDEDIGNAYLFALATWAFGIIAGGVLGNLVFSKRRRNRSR
jgi:Na+/glutamate symporter